MVTRRILVIDDEMPQAKALAEKLGASIPMSKVMYASDKEEILSAIDNRFFNLAILDLRMDGYGFDGIELAKRILETNPFAKILFVSKFIPEYLPMLTPMLRNGNILGFSDKKVNYDEWMSELREQIMPYYEELDANPQSVSVALLNLYADLKDEPDTYAKGVKLEDFTALLFQYIGFSETVKRTRDKSLNEVDLIIRNDIEDPFLSKFGKYILVECKNHTEDIDKNTFILFNEKLRNTNGLAELGFLVTTSGFKRTARLEALRTSGGSHKIVFIDNAIMLRIIGSEDPREELKRVIDHQVKDN